MTEAIVIMIGGIFLFCFLFWKAIKFECGTNLCNQDNKITPTYTVLTVKNIEDSIEGVLYSLLKQLNSNHKAICTQNILVVDLGSTDNTMEILKKMTNKYECIHILSSNLFIDMVKD